LIVVYLQAGLEVGLESALNGSHVLTGGNPGLTVLAAAGKGKILGHDTLLVDNIDTGALELLGESNNIGGVIELSTLDQTTGPGKDGSDGVGGGLAALLVLAVVAGNGTVSGLGLERLAVRGDKSRGHETEGAKALGNDIGLDITIVVYQRLELR
jgi:hypothetical protein